MKYDVRKMDLDSLDDLIKQCEDAMVRPLSKKKTVELTLLDENDEGEGESEHQYDESESDEEAKPDLSEMDLEDLLEAYRDLKDRE